VVYDGVVSKGVVREDLVRLVDLSPTIRHLAGLVPETPLADGNDFFPAEPTLPTETAVYSETFRGKKTRSLRTSSHQLIFNTDDDTWEFYSLREDPKARRNSYEAAIRRNETFLTNLKAGLIERITPKPHALEGTSVELDDVTIEHLKELGYLQ
jgi:arylsulfatase A-like enzyme